MMALAEAASAIGARTVGMDVTFESVSIDSRTVGSGALFVAIRGERFDGHRFVAAAAHAGAVAAMVEAPPPAAEAPDGRLALLVVDDTRRALARLAAYWRAKFTCPLIALTGSSGKTSVKEMLAAILREAVRGTALADETDPRVLATRGNLNNDLGVPLTLLELTAARRYAVVELGMNHAGEIRDLAQLAAPQVALVTNAGSAHLGLLGSLEAIALAKGEIYEALGSDGTAVINADDAFAPLWRKIAAEKPVLDFGLTPEAAVSASYTLHQLESEIVVKTPLGEAPFLLRAPGLHNVRNAAAAAAAATALDLTPDIIAAGLTRYRGVKGRLQQKTAINGAVLIDDTYNANPESVRAAIAVLAQVPGRRILVLGDMGELGPDAERLHVEVGDAARLGGVDRLYALGELAAKAVEAFGPGATHFARIEDLLAAVENELAPRVTVLVKGSRFMRMERVVAAFEAREDE